MCGLGGAKNAHETQKSGEPGSPNLTTAAKLSRRVCERTKDGLTMAQNGTEQALDAAS
jgi:hypothetical protein